MSLGDEHACQVKGISTICIKLFNGMMRELKDMRNEPQLKKNLISAGALEAQGLEGLLKKAFLRTSSGSLVFLKGIRRNNLYYLKGNAVP